MHHALRLYSRYRERVLRFYMFWAKWTRIPVIGSIIRWVANLYGRNVENGYVLSTEEACQIVDISKILYVGPCTCREVFKNCDNPVNVEIMLGFSGNAFIDERSEDYRKITGEEAKEILTQCHERGLVHSIIKCRNDFFAICNCCTCCCVPLRLHREYGIGNALKRNPDIVQQFKEYGESHSHADS